MNRWTRRLLLLTLSLCLLAGCCAAETLRGYDAAVRPHYQYVQLGNYPYEADGTPAPVLWWVLGVENGQALLLSEQILDVQQVIFCDDQKAAQETRAFRRITDYADSDLCQWMNSEMLDRLLGGDPMLGALAETRYGRLYPPTDEQLLNRAYGFSAARYGDEYYGFPERRAVGTPYAKTVSLFPNWNTSNHTLFVYADFGTSPYWSVGFQNVSESNLKFSLVGYNGHISYGVYTRINVGVRPALTLDLNLCRIAGGSGTAEEPFVMEAVSGADGIH